MEIAGSQPVHRADFHSHPVILSVIFSLADEGPFGYRFALMDGPPTGIKKPTRLRQGVGLTLIILGIPGVIVPILPGFILIVLGLAMMTGRKIGLKKIMERFRIGRRTDV